MAKKYARGNRQAQRYRARVRAGNDWTIYAPWGKPLFDGRGSRPSFPPPGWLYYENQFGRGFINNKTIESPYDKRLSTDRMSIKTPPEYRPLFVVQHAESDKTKPDKKGTE